MVIEYLILPCPRVNLNRMNEGLCFWPAALPDVPTLHEAGVKAFDHANAAYGAYVPAGTPPDAVRRLESALIAAMRAPQVKETLGRAGLGATGLPGKELRRVLDEERRFWRPIVQASGFRGED